MVASVEAFRSEFTEPTWTKLLVWLWGTIRARGRRTLTAALRQMGRDDDADFSKYPHLFNRAVWSPLRLARRLTRLLVRTFFRSDLRLTCVLDETLERRWGRCIRLRGPYRDPLASRQERSVAASGLRWIVLALSVTPPWSPKPWAWPVWSRPSPTPTVSAQLGRRPQTLADWARPVILWLRRGLPGADLTVVGDQTSSVLERGRGCPRPSVRLIAPRRLEARLFASPPPRPAGTLGRPRIVGARPPHLEVVLIDPSTAGEPVTRSWSDGTERVLEVAPGTALWSSSGREPWPIRWVLSRDPQGEWEPRGSFSTCPEDTAASRLAESLRRGPLETTFEESRAHRGIETQRQGSDLALGRETPGLFGLDSLIVLFGQALPQEPPLTIRTAAWSPQPQATFCDVLAAVRRHCWEGLDIQTSHHDPTCVEIPKDQFNRLLSAVCYSH
jgi:hypothetical protein